METTLIGNFRTNGKTVSQLWQKNFLPPQTDNFWATHVFRIQMQRPEKNHPTKERFN